MKTKAGIGLFLAFVLVLSGLLFRPAAPAYADDLTILKFGTMVGVPPAYIGTMNRPIRDVNGAGRPWVINSAEGKLTAAGKLNVQFTGLVFDPTDPGVIAAGLANRNTVGSMKVVVSCQTINGGTAKAETGLFPVTTGALSDGAGSGSIQTFVDLPHPCIAPLIFVTSPGGAWFATTGY